MKSRWGLYSHLKMKNNSLANRNRGTMPRFLGFGFVWGFFAILQSQQA